MNQRQITPIEQLEATILDVFHVVLGADAGVTTTINFFDLGSDSLLLAQIYNQLEKLYPAQITLTNMFAYPTISRLAKFIADQEGMELEAYPVPLDYMQNTGQVLQDHRYEFRIEKDRFNEIRDLSRIAGCTPVEWLWSLFAYLLTEIGNQPQLTVYTLIYRMNHISSISLDVQEVQDFNELFVIAKQALHTADEQPGHHIQDLVRTGMKSQHVAIRPLFYEADYVSGGRVALEELFDVICEIQNEKRNMLVTMYCKPRMNTIQWNLFFRTYDQMLAKVFESLRPAAERG
ncbi:acyl carrier protein [Paenibacillus sp. FSL H7-0942]|uniref:Acyl carrier protein n=1 Tax=Paenibacillus amylolyticus TaxID=1451 RepID=A0ABD8AR44_PAEAM|nr:MULTISPECIES: acyl carrier protein [Paenibacillus]ETT40852.1 amino acid adenylation domain-containing protein [Paenibacillus sp. FSL R5-192]OME94462.1 hypothetical protein BK124_22560 [Paenibacillus amylolyticus]OMF04092.1 hypothetical protein BK129_19245 [Paenibacillus amylolyticus]